MDNDDGTEQMDKVALYFISWKQIDGFCKHAAQTEWTRTTTVKESFKFIRIRFENQFYF